MIHFVVVDERGEIQGICTTNSEEAFLAHRVPRGWRKVRIRPEEAPLWEEFDHERREYVHRVDPRGRRVRKREF